jgi:hypothetical protein
MIAKSKQNVAVPGQTLPNRVLIPVPWDEADRLCSRLRERGIEATACFDAADRSAGIELPPGADTQAVQHFLDEELRGKAVPK